MLRPILLATLALSVAACSSEEVQPSPEPTVVEAPDEPSEPSDAERARRKAKERSPLVATNTLEGIQMALAAQPRRFEPPVNDAPLTKDSLLSNYAAMAEYRKIDPKAALAQDLSTLDRRIAHIKRELGQLEREGERARPRSDRAREIGIEIQRFTRELEGHQAQTQLMREALKD